MAPLESSRNNTPHTTEKGGRINLRSLAWWAGISASLGVFLGFLQSPMPILLIVAVVALMWCLITMRSFTRDKEGRGRWLRQGWLFALVAVVCFWLGQEVGEFLIGSLSDLSGDDFRIFLQEDAR